MEVSKYTRFIKHPKGLFVYNSLSNCLIQIDNELFDILNNKNERLYKLDEFQLQSRTILELKNAMVIVDNVDDDKLQYCSAIWGRRRTENIYNITIAPTMDCNYHCYYCFENPTKSVMSNEVISRIGKYLSGIHDARFINLTWFGGEPLMAIPQINMISTMLNRFEESVLNCKIITNGYLLTDKVTDSLSLWHIKEVQITVDGLFEQYDRIKYTKNDKHCFNSLIHNIDYFAEKNKEIALSIRVNMNKENMNNFYQIAEFFVKRYPNNKNIYPYAAFLKNINNKTSKVQACTYCTIDDQVDFSLSMYNKTKKKVYIYPRNEFDECAIRNHNSWAFGPDGSVYKCWENIGNYTERVGVLDENGKIKILNNNKLLRYYFGADPLYSDDCKNCFYLPICHGRCPRQRILEELNLTEKEPCMKDTNCIDQYLNQVINNL